MEAKRILLAEDDMMIRTAIKRFLEIEGFIVLAVDNGSDALLEYSNNKIDLVMLDLLLPGIDGWKVVAKIRQRHETPIMVISGEVDEQSQIKAFDLGIDDYVTKPFNLQILVAKTKRMLKRTGSVFVVNESTSKIQIGSLTLDKRQQTCYVGGNFINLTQKEFQLIRFLVSNKDKVLSRNEVFNNVWEDSDTDIRIVDVYVNKVRDKIKDSNVRIYTKFGKGYVLSQKYQ